MPHHSGRYLWFSEELACMAFSNRKEIMKYHSLIRYYASIGSQRGSGLSFHSNNSDEQLPSVKPLSEKLVYFFSIFCNNH